jgi:hypothetical protein
MQDKGMIDREGYKSADWKEYHIEATYRFSFSAKSKSGALGMWENEIENPKWTDDGEIDQTSIKIIKVYSDDDGEQHKLLYSKNQS